MRYSKVFRLIFGVAVVLNVTAATVCGEVALGSRLAHAEDSASPLRLQSVLPSWLELSASHRVRYSYLHNQFRPLLDRNDQALSLRTLLYGALHFGGLSVVGELQDSRAYLTDEHSAVSTIVVNTLEPLQAYVGLSDRVVGEKGLGPDGVAWELKLGRQTIDLGSRRFIARNRYRNTIQNYTGLTGMVETKNTTVFGFFVLPLQVEPRNIERAALLDNKIEFDKERWGLRLFGVDVEQRGLPLDVMAQSYLYVLQEEDDAQHITQRRQLYTGGLRLWRKPKVDRWDGEVEGTLQMGSRRTDLLDSRELRRDVLAGFFHGEVGRSFGVWSAPRLSAELDYATGTRAGSDKFGHFDSLFGPRRAEFGPTGIYGPLGRENIISAGSRVKFEPHALVDGFFSWRANWLDQRSDFFARTLVRDPAGKSGRFAGHQLETRVRTWIVPGNLRWEVGGAVLLRGRFLREAPASPKYGDSVFGYTDLELTF